MNSPIFNENERESSPSTSSMASSSRTSLMNITRVCRICQSETGIMVRPCFCAGTMGDIHEKCLNEWVSRSRAEKCEICKKPYAKSSKSFKKLSDWSRPQINFRQWVALMALFCLLYSQINLIKVAWERQFFDRVFINRYRPRSPDVAKFMTIIVLFLLSSMVLSILVNGICGYFSRQRIVRFVDNDAHDQEKKLDDISN